MPTSKQGHGIPNQLSENCRTSHVSLSLLPSLIEAVRSNESGGGYLTAESSFGIDPLAGSKMTGRRQWNSFNSRRFIWICSYTHFFPFFIDKSVQLQAEMMPLKIIRDSLQWSPLAKPIKTADRFFLSFPVLCSHPIPVHLCATWTQLLCFGLGLKQTIYNLSLL